MTTLLREQLLSATLAPPTNLFCGGGGGRVNFNFHLVNQFIGS
jgi:hypothetical protein